MYNDGEVASNMFILASLLAMATVWYCHHLHPFWYTPIHTFTQEVVKALSALN